MEGNGGDSRVMSETEGIGGHCGNMGLGNLCKTQVGKAEGKERHHILQEEVRAGIEEEWVSRVVDLRQQ